MIANCWWSRQGLILASALLVVFGLVLTLMGMGSHSILATQAIQLAWGTICD